MKIIEHNLTKNEALQMLADGATLAISKSGDHISAVIKTRDNHLYVILQEKMPEEFCWAVIP